MVASRYRNALAYAPGYSPGDNYTEAPPRRNALVDAYAPSGPASFGAPTIAGAAPSAPMAAAGPSLSGGSGQISGAPEPRWETGDGGVMQEQYGGPGPLGAPSTGNFGRDALGFGRHAGGAVASMAFGGPMAIAGVAGIGALAGALRAAGYNSLAETLVSANFGMPSLGRGATSENMGTDGEQGGMKDATFGNVSPENPAGSDTDKGFGNEFATPGGVVDGVSAENTSAGGEMGGDKGGTAGDVSADNPAFREGGYTGDDGDGELEPMDATLHEGEFVIRPEAVRMYGRDFFGALNAGQMPPNMLAGAMRPRPQSARNVLDMMRR